ncbi:MAG: hypothetical protein ACKOC9_15720 [Alphaproteobacteria bacterium]
MHITIGIATRGRPAILAGVLRDLARQAGGGGDEVNAGDGFTAGYIIG